MQTTMKSTAVWNDSTGNNKKKKQKRKNVNDRRRHRFLLCMQLHSSSWWQTECLMWWRRDLQDDSSKWWWIAKFARACLNKNTSVLCMNVFKRSSKKKKTHYESKVSSKLIQFDGKALTGCWCDWVFFLFKAITAPLHKRNWFSPINRLWIMPRGLVTVALDRTPPCWGYVCSSCVF